MLRTCRSSLETRSQTIGNHWHGIRLYGATAGRGLSLASRVYLIGDGAGAECVASTPYAALAQSTRSLICEVQESLIVTQIAGSAPVVTSFC
jgi:hypothetical protein